jgi:HlyD family secretion protein
MLECWERLVVGEARVRMDMPTPGARTETEPAPPIDRRSTGRHPTIAFRRSLSLSWRPPSPLSQSGIVRGEPLLVQGEVDATRFDIAARVDGRVGEIPVSRGENVAANAVLVRIDNPKRSPSTNRRWRPRSLPMRSLQTSTPAPAQETIAARKARSSGRRRAWFWQSKPTTASQLAEARQCAPGAARPGHRYPARKRTSRGSGQIGARAGSQRLYAGGTRHRNGQRREGAR